ncbi:MAG TPA: hypothetical protein VFG11_09915, partial [Acidobacteriota bacterium]|nr:hypothetical protein [Acidobacteriota bacterium]
MMVGRKLVLFLVFCILAAQSLIAEQRLIVAVPKFQNSTGKTLRMDSSKMAAMMANQLKKSKKFQPADNNKLINAMKGALWMGTGYDQDTEARIKGLPADFVLYGAIESYKIENYIPYPIEGGESQLPWVKLEYSIRFVDLIGKRSDLEFRVQGDSLGDRRVNWGGPPYDENN